jgi:hypothetical protein
VGCASELPVTPAMMAVASANANAILLNMVILLVEAGMASAHKTACCLIYSRTAIEVSTERITAT